MRERLECNIKIDLEIGRNTMDFIPFAQEKDLYYDLVNIVIQLYCTFASCRTLLFHFHLSFPSFVRLIDVFFYFFFNLVFSTLCRFLNFKLLNHSLNNGIVFFFLFIFKLLFY
jgi:hypothetical protein